jgi:hypothetical protein
MEALSHTPLHTSLTISNCRMTAQMESTRKATHTRTLTREIHTFMTFYSSFLFISKRRCVCVRLWWNECAIFSQHEMISFLFTCDNCVCMSSFPSRSLCPRCEIWRCTVRLFSYFLLTFEHSEHFARFEIVHKRNFALRFFPHFSFIFFSLPTTTDAADSHFFFSHLKSLFPARVAFSTLCIRQM